MGNMGYCMFENTLNDLIDCYEHMEDDLSKEESKARKRMIKLCANIANDFVEQEDE